MRALSSFVILAAAIGFGSIYVVHDGIFDAGRFVRAVPIAAVLVLVLSLAARGLVSGAAFSTPVRPRRRGNPIVVIIFGGIGLIACGAFALNAARDANAFVHDPTCGGSGGLGACRDTRATIVDTYHVSGKGGGTDHVRLLLDDDTRPDVVVGRRVSGDAWAGAHRNGDRQAFVRVFRSRVVSVSTASGFFYTSDYPPDRVRQATIATGVFGFLFVFGIALRAALPRSASF